MLTSVPRRKGGYKHISLLAALCALEISEGELEGYLDEAAFLASFAFGAIPLQLEKSASPRIKGSTQGACVEARGGESATRGSSRSLQRDEAGG